MVVYERMYWSCVWVFSICSTSHFDRDSFCSYARLSIATKLQSRYTKRTTLREKRQTHTLPARSKAVVVNTLRTLIVVVWPRHVTLALTLIDDKDDFGSDLSPEEC